jgi:hypothetical protein
MVCRSKKQRRRRQRKAIARRAAIAPYVVELERAKVPPLVVKQAKAVMLLLLGARR